MFVIQFYKSNQNYNEKVREKLDFVSSPYLFIEVLV